MNSGNSSGNTVVSWLLLFAFLFVTALALYAPIMSSPFGGTEYKTYLWPLKEHLVSSFDFIAKWSPLAVREVKFSRPLLKLLLLVEYRLWGHDPLPYRLLNLLMLVGGGMVATWIVVLVTGRRELAWLAGLILCVHPSAVPAVRWISARGDLAAGFFSLLALGALFWLISSEDHPPAWWRALLPVLFVFLALSSKELGLANFIALPVTWFLWPGGRRDRRTGMIMLFSLAVLVAGYFGWRFFLFHGIGGYGMIPSVIEWPERLGVLLWQTSGAYLMPSIVTRTIYLVLLFASIILLCGRSALRWRRTGVLALILAVYGFQSIIAGIQDTYYAYAPATILAILLVTVLVDCPAKQPLRAGVVLLLLLPFIGIQVHTTALTNMNRAVELEVTERLMAAIEEKERLMDDGALFFLVLVGVERDIRIRDQSKIINAYFRFLRGPEGPAIRRHPKKLPENPPVLAWDGINLSLRPPLVVAAGQPSKKK
jgi:hypothetical protein